MSVEPPDPIHEPTSGGASGAPPSPGGAASGCLQPLGILAIAVALAIALGGGLLAGRLTAPEAPAQSQEVIYRGPAVVTAVRDLARLESARFHMERVIDLKEKQEKWLGLLEAEDAILLVAAADVTAGVDLSKLEEGDVEIDRQASRVRIELPPVEVLDTSIDTKRTYVHRRDTDLLADRKEDLETRARQEALNELQEAAIAAGLMDRAKANAASTVTSLVRSLGYDDVEVTFRD